MIIYDVRNSPLRDRVNQSRAAELGWMTRPADRGMLQEQSGVLSTVEIAVVAKRAVEELV